MLKARSLAAYPLVLALFLTYGCDQFSSARYEITKDQAGRTLRLDKRTGEVTVVDGERLVPVRDAKAVQSEQVAKADELASMKSHSAIEIPMGFNATLKTSWQDGKLLYVVRFVSSKAAKSAKGSDPQKMASSAKVDWSTFYRHRFTLTLEDAPFELATEKLSFIGVVDNTGNQYMQEAKGGVAMSAETYKRIDGWNLTWRTQQF